MPARLVAASFGRAPETEASLSDSVLDSLTDRIAVLDTTGLIVAVNRAWKDFASACGADVASTCEGANYIAVCDAAKGDGAEDARHVSTALKEMSLGSRCKFVAEYPCHGPDPGQEAWFEIRATPFRRDKSRFITVVHSDRTQRVKAERERERADRLVARLRRLMRDLYQTQSRLRRAQEAAGMVAFEMDVGGPSPEAPDALQRLLGLSADTGENNLTLLGAVHVDDQQALGAALSRLSTNGGNFQQEFRLEATDGRPRWIQLLGIGDSKAGAPYRFVGVAIDVTERRRGEAQRDLLAREIDHRARNVLAVVQAVLRLSLPREGGAYVKALEGRIAALARAHVLLSEGSWTGASLRAIVEGEVEPYLGTKDPRIHIKGKPIALAPAAAQALSLVVHELATNSAKHGALSHTAGRLSIRWHVDASTEQLAFSWKERGGPVVAGPPTRRGFGTRVVASTVRHQLGGSLVETWDAEGLHVEILVPLARVLSAQG